MSPRRPSESRSRRTAPLPELPEGVSHHTLPHGLTLIVREDASAPVVSAQAWCRTGSIDEGRWLGAGLSHVLEHMLFKGTTRRPGSRIDQEVQDAGGYMNAYTSFDRTVFWINVPNTGWPVAVDILCDIMLHATLPEDELAKELDVIRREMDMGQDDPHRRSSRRLFETAYTRSPYRYSIIGVPELFSRLTPADIRAYYEERYVPNNLFFVVVGDVKAAEVAECVTRAFASSRARSVPAVVLPEEPRQAAPRTVIEEDAVQLGHVHLSWHTPGLRHPDVPVLDVLATLLGGGRSSRLHQRVREKLGLVHSAEAWTYNPGSSGLFGLSAVVDGERFAPAREAVLAEVERMQDRPVTAAELRKAVKQFIAGTLASRKTMQGQAQDLGGSWLAAQDLNFSERYLAAIKQVTPADLLRVARTYLTPENRTLYALLPRGHCSRETQSTTIHAEHPVRLVTLPNGLRLLIKESHRLPFVELRAVLRGGVLAESTHDTGITLLLSRMLLQGTTSRTAEQIATTIESVGGSVDSYAGNNSFGLSLEVMREDFATGVDLLGDILLRPGLRARPLEREREVQLAGIKAQKDHLLQSAFRSFRRTLFGPQGYGLDAQGEELTVRGLSAAALRGFHQRLVVPANTVIAIYGDVNSASAEAALRRTFGRWRRAPAPLMAPPPSHAEATDRRASEEADKKQAVVVLGFPGTEVTRPDRFALELLRESCSDLGSRLFLRIREKLGLAYYVGAQNFPGLAPGYFAFYAGTAPDKVDLVEQEFLHEAELLRSGGLTSEELARAKAKIIGQRKIARQDLAHQALSQALDELYGLGYANAESEDDRYAAVTLDDLRAVANAYLRPERAVTAVVRGTAAG